MRLRALMTTGTDGGAWTFAVELAAALSRSGSQIDLATIGENLTPAQRAEAEEVPRLRLHEGCCAPEWNEDGRHAVDGTGEWLLGLERSLVIDRWRALGAGHRTDRLDAADRRRGGRV